MEKTFLKRSRIILHLHVFNYTSSERINGTTSQWLREMNVRCVFTEDRMQIPIFTLKHSGIVYFCISVTEVSHGDGTLTQCNVARAETQLCFTDIKPSMNAPLNLDKHMLWGSALRSIQSALSRLNALLPL